MFFFSPDFKSPAFEQMNFICRACGHMFQGRDCEKVFLFTLFGIYPALIPPFGPKCPKCPECGKYNTEKNPAVVY